MIVNCGRKGLWRLVSGIVLVGAMVFSCGPAAADGGAPGDEDNFMLVASVHGDAAFVVEKSYGDSPEYRSKHKAQQADFAYTVRLNVEDPGAERTVAVYTESAVVPAGEDAVVIDVSRYVMALRQEMKMSGSVQFSLETPPGSNYGAGGSSGMTVYSADYQQGIVDDVDGYAKFAEDYQQFIMDHPGWDVADINRAFIKKYPQYRKQLPQVD